MPAELVMIVGRHEYGGWKSIRVTRSIESLAGSFALEVSDRWGEQQDPWPIAEEDACRVEIRVDRARTVVIDGYVDRRSISLSATARTLSYSGRDRAAALVDCSAVLTQWTYRNVTIADFIRTLAAPFSVAVSVQAGLELAKQARLVVQPGDKVFDAIARETAAAGVLVVSDGAGGILITRAAAARAASLVQGSNLLGASVEYDGTERYARYVIATQVAGTDEAAGDATRIRAEATDQGVRRADRVLLLRPERGLSVPDARRRADWEARIRAARAETVTAIVQGWMQPNGTLWPLNALTRVTAPAIGVDGDLLISQVEHSIGDGGQVTQMRLVRPDAFTPEPVAATVKSSGERWLINRNGELVVPGGR